MRALLVLPLALGAVYVFLAGLLTLMQGRILYPGAGTAAPAPGVAAGLGLTALSDAPSPRAFATDAGPRGTVVVFHGNAGTALDRGYYLDALGRRGLRVVLAEYPGYGGRPGPPTEAALAADAAETIRLVRDRFDGPLLVWGESLGAGVAAAAVARAGDAVDGVVLLTPWDSLVETARGVYGWLPVGLLLRDRYDSVGNLRGAEVPVAVVVAERDEVIPSARGRALFAALDGPKRLWTFPDAGHNTWPAGPGEAWWDEVLTFVLPAE